MFLEMQTYTSRVRTSLTKGSLRTGWFTSFEQKSLGCRVIQFPWRSKNHFISHLTSVFLILQYFNVSSANNLFSLSVLHIPSAHGHPFCKTSPLISFSDSNCVRRLLHTKSGSDIKKTAFVGSGGRRHIHGWRFISARVLFLPHFYILQFRCWRWYNHRVSAA